jgi:hypothetical protein
MLLVTNEIKQERLTKWHSHFTFKKVHVGNNQLAFLQVVERRAIFMDAFDKQHKVFEYRLPNSVEKKERVLHCAAKTKVATRKPKSSNNKREQVEAIVKSMPNSARSDILDRIMKETNMTKTGASTYYYNAKKALTI